ncbi:MAG: hypothetical protein KF696_15805 [Planctomycetes bacterium]|nr:hypothetical protein [Planctomycetota bacterium]MCW8136227.1 hypothetical protein [Planctomycetota bacterium]
MTNELSPDGPELQPDMMGDFAEEGGSEDASQLLPPIRELPTDREYVPGAFYSIQPADGTPSGKQLGEILGSALFQSLADVHLFGRNAANEPWLEVGPMTPEPAQILVAQELLPGTGQPLAQDDLEMFEMVAGRVAKTLGRAKQPPAEDAAKGAARSAQIAALKGKLGDKFGLALAGDFDIAKVTDCCLCLGMKRVGTVFAWLGGQAMGEPVFTVAVDGAQLAPGAAGKTKRVTFSYPVAAVKQPRKVLERIFAATHYFTRRLGGTLQLLDGSAPGDGVARGEHPKLEAIIKKIESAGLKPGNVVARRLV